MNIQVNIQSNDRTNYILQSSFRITDILNARVNTCSFETRKYGDTKTWKPSVGDEIEVLDGATKIFAGIIISLEETLEGARLQKFKINCKDWTHYLNKRLVTERYEDKTVDEIITNVLSVYTAGFTTTNVNCDITIDSIAFNYVSVSEAIQMLAEQVNFSWYVDYAKDIHFFSKNAEPSPFNLNDDDGNYIFESLKLLDDLSQLRNLVIVRGGEKVASSTREEHFEGDGTKKTFALGYKFSETPIVTISGSAMTVGIDFLNLDDAYDVMWNFNEKYIRVTGSAVGIGTAVLVTGTPLIPIIVQVLDEDSIDTYGQYEFKKIDKSIKTTNEAKQYALAQLEAYKNSIKEGSFRTYTSGLRSGQTIEISSTIRSITAEDFILQRVTIQMRNDTEALYSVELATLRTIGIIDFLQGLLFAETKKIEIGENEVLEKYYTDHADINVTEEITLHSEVTDHQSINVTELIRNDPWSIVWVLAERFPDDDDDPKREGRLSTSFYLY